MKKSILSRGIVGCVAALAVSGVTAGAASAVPATFNLTGSATPTESAPLTFKIGTTPTPDRIITCSPGSPFASQSASTSNSGSPTYGFLGFGFHDYCVNGLGGGAFVDVYQIGNTLQAQKVGSVYSLTSPTTLEVHITSGSSSYQSAFGQVVSFSAGWTNGTSVANPSTVNFSNTAIGKANAGSAGAGLPITLSGAIKLTTGGSLLTLN